MKAIRWYAYGMLIFYADFPNRLISHHFAI